MKKRNLLITILCCIHIAAALYTFSVLDTYENVSSSAALPSSPNALPSPPDASPSPPDVSPSPPDASPSSPDALAPSSPAPSAKEDTVPTAQDIPISKQDMPGSDSTSSRPEPVPFIVRSRLNLHIRQDASLNAKIIGRIPPAGSGVVLELADDKWAKILYDGIEGYAATDYLDFDIAALANAQIPAEEFPSEDAGNLETEAQPEQDTQKETRILIINSCYIRSSPNANTRENIVATAQPEDMFEHMEEYDIPGWYAVHLDGQKTAYVSQEYATIYI